MKYIIYSLISLYGTVAVQALGILPSKWTSHESYSQSRETWGEISSGALGRQGRFIFKKMNKPDDFSSSDYIKDFIKVSLDSYYQKLGQKLAKNVIKIIEVSDVVSVGGDKMYYFSFRTLYMDSPYLSPRYKDLCIWFKGSTLYLFEASYSFDDVDVGLKKELEDIFKKTL